jgi:type I restriction enzyme S subunit
MKLLEKRIGDIVEKRIETFDKNSVSQFRYVDISSIDNVKKEIVDSKGLLSNEAPSRAKYILKKGDVIVSNVRPNLNAIAVVNEFYDLSIGSSGLTVLRPIGEIDSDYLFLNLISSNFLNYIETLVQGAMYPAINDSDVKRFKIKLPENKSDQQRIATEIKSKLEKVEQMRQAALKQKEAIKALQGALLREVFPYKQGAELPKGWKWEKIGNIFEEEKNQVQPYEEDFKTLPFIGLENIVSHTREYTDEEYNPPSSTCFKFDESNVLYGKLRPYLNKVYLPSSPGKSSMELIPLKTKNKYSRSFLAAILQSEMVIGNTVKFSTGGRMPRADLTKLKKLEAAIPVAYDKCNQIGNLIDKKIKEIVLLKKRVCTQLEAIEAMPAAILREVFDFKK